MWRERDTALGHDVHDLPMRIGDPLSCQRIREYPITVGCAAPMAHDIPEVASHRQDVVRPILGIDGTYRAALQVDIVPSKA